MKYHKIQTMWLRDPENNHKTLLPHEWATPEFEALHDLPWIAEEKVDGTNIRVMFDPVGSRVEFRGKTDKAQTPPFLLERLAEMFTKDTMLSAFPVVDDDPLQTPAVILYGEGYGARIQKGGGDYIPDGVSFILFDVNIGGVWLDRASVLDIAEKLGIKKAPVVGRMTLSEAADLTEERGYGSELRATPPEGLVLRPPVELLDRRGKRIIAKIKLKDFR